MTIWMQKSKKTYQIANHCNLQGCQQITKSCKKTYLPDKSQYFEVETREFLNVDILHLLLQLKSLILSLNHRF